MANPTTGFDVSTKTDGIQEKLVSVRRTAQVVKGGRIFSFSAITVVGDGKGRVGIGLGKSREVPAAIQKSLESARRSMVYIPLNGDTLFHEVIANHGASKVIMLPASKGTGIIAGGAMRALFEVVGIQNVLGKCIGSTNPVNVIKATLKALRKMSSPTQVMERRGIARERLVLDHVVATD
ncbi:MAG: 30S ribosomal protein S5 [Legionellales bacterium]|jgi:small subunit ribosomal protein S5